MAEEEQLAVTTGPIPGRDRIAEVDTAHGLPRVGAGQPEHVVEHRGRRPDGGSRQHGLDDHCGVIVDRSVGERVQLGALEVNLRSVQVVLD